MRDLYELDKYRLEHPLYGWGDGGNGAFQLPSPLDGKELRVIASNGYGWDHLSVSLVKRIPLWTEMEFIKRKFFRDDETAMQLHVPPAKHISVHPHTLHIWAPQTDKIPLPPEYMIA